MLLTIDRLLQIRTTWSINEGERRLEQLKVFLTAILFPSDILKGRC